MRVKYYEIVNDWIWQISLFTFTIQVIQTHSPTFPIFE